MTARGVDGCRDATLRHVVRSRWRDDRSRRAARRSPAPLLQREPQKQRAIPRESVSWDWDGCVKSTSAELVAFVAFAEFGCSKVDFGPAARNYEGMRMTPLRFLPLVLLSLGAAASSGQSAALVGSVFKDSARKTIPGAEVSIPDLDLTTRATEA